MATFKGLSPRQQQKYVKTYGGLKEKNWTYKSAPVNKFKQKNELIKYLLKFSKALFNYAFSINIYYFY